MNDWSKFRNVLCVRPDNIGDVLMTTPAIRALKQGTEGRRITLLASHAGASIARHVPAIDECLEFEPSWYRHPRPAKPEESLRLIETLRERRFDAAVIFTVFSQSPLPTAMLCHLAGIRRVAAYCRENPYALISDWLPDEEPLYRMEHEVRRQLRLARHVGAPASVDDRLSFKLPMSAQNRVGNLLDHYLLSNRRDWVVLHAGASEQRRRYPQHLFVEAVEALRKDLGLRVVLTGTDQERGLLDQIAAAVGGDAISLAGQLGIEELAVLLSRAPLLISNNTGPVHLAAAVRTPVVVLYALTNPQHTPWGVPHRVLPFDVMAGGHSRNVLVRYAREQAFKREVGLVKPAEIVQACRELLHDQPLAGRPIPSIVTLDAEVPMQGARAATAYAGYDAGAG